MNLGTWTWTTRRGLATLHVTCFPGMPLFQFYKPFLPTLRAFLSMVWALLGPNPLGLGTKKIIMLKHFWANLLICVGSPFCRVASSSHVCVWSLWGLNPFSGKRKARSTQNSRNHPLSAPKKRQQRSTLNYKDLNSIQFKWAFRYVKNIYIKASVGPLIIRRCWWKGGTRRVWIRSSWISRV